NHTGEPLVLHEPAALTPYVHDLEAVFGVEDTWNAEPSPPRQRSALVELDDLRPKGLSFAIGESEHHGDAAPDRQLAAERNDERIPTPVLLGRAEDAPHCVRGRIDLGHDIEFDRKSAGRHRRRRVRVVPGGGHRAHGTPIRRATASTRCFWTTGDTNVVVVRF